MRGVRGGHWTLQQGQGRANRVFGFVFFWKAMTILSGFQAINSPQYLLISEIGMQLAINMHLKGGSLSTQLFLNLMISFTMNSILKWMASSKSRKYRLFSFLTYLVFKDNSVNTGKNNNISFLLWIQVYLYPHSYSLTLIILKTCSQPGTVWYGRTVKLRRKLNTNTETPDYISNCEA